MSNADISRYGRRIVQYIWDPEPVPEAGSEASKVWCLGRSYRLHVTTVEARPDGDASQAQDSMVLPTPDCRPASPGSGESSFEEIHRPAAVTDIMESRKLVWPDDFLDDFEARIWLTYRSGFAEIAKSEDPAASSKMSLSVRLKSQLTSMTGFTSDTGWGCMIRTGQSLLANSIATLRLGRDWRRRSQQQHEGTVLRMFADDPAAPFSIHRFVAHGAKACGTFPGQWFGPSATAKCIEALSNSCEAPALKVYTNGDGPDVYQDAVMELAKSGGASFTPVLLLISTRLGIDRVTPAYWSALKKCLQLPQSMGIAGGRPSASHYFVGAQASSLFYLDPHHTRSALPLRAPDNYTIEEVDSCHTRRLRRLRIDDMDPSMLIGFLIRSEEDWADWRGRIGAAHGKAIVHVFDHPASPRSLGERGDAIDEVLPLDEDDEDDQADNGSDDSTAENIDLAGVDRG